VFGFVKGKRIDSAEGREGCEEAKLECLLGRIVG
jgi:hypothetical protein